MTLIPIADFATFEKRLAKFRHPRKGSDSFWTALLRFVRSNEQFLGDLDQIRSCCRFLQGRLVELKCTDANVFSRVLRASSLWSLYRILTGGVEVARSRPLSFIDVTWILQPLDLEEEVTRRPVFGDVETVDMCFEVAEAGLMEVLVRYGLTDEPRVINFHEFNKAKDLLTAFWLYMDRQELQEPNFDDEPSLVKFTKEILHDLRSTNGRMQSKNERGFMRILLMLRIIKALILKRRGSPFAEDYAICLKLYLEIIPDPFFPKEEVLEFLEFLLFDEADVARSWMLTYVSMFPYESSLSYSPRSLKHLSRCFVRRYLHSQQKLLFEAVRHFEIPETLKDFLLGIS